MSNLDRQGRARRWVAGVAVLALVAGGMPASSSPMSAASGGAGADSVSDAPRATPASAPPAGCVGTPSPRQNVVPRDPAAAPYQRALAPDESAVASYDGARLIAAPDAVDEPVTIGITPLAAGGLPEMGDELTNVTAGPRKGWRFSPHPFQFAEPVEIRLAYDPKAVAPTFNPQDVYTFFYDEQAGCWKALDRVSVDEKTHEIVSRTDHFTVMANAVLSLPESPDIASFNPTQIKGLQVASPDDGMDQINPPVAASGGQAVVTYPIEVPQGRAGLQPTLAISYDSTGADSWLGQGWDLPVPSISVDTRWGVPRYDATRETETYQLGSEQLAPVAHRSTPVARVAERVFHQRMEGAFTRIVRHGTNPSTYSWETTDKSGQHSFYGGTPESTLRDDAGRVFQWALREVRDTHGNIMRFHTVIQDDTGVTDGTVPGRNLYLQKITYTGSAAAADGPYAVTFIRDRELAEPRRGDVGIDARGGFKRVTADLLRRIEITMNDLPVRAYEMNYTTGAFDKTLLESITEFGEDNRPFNTHTFAYYDDIRDSSGAYQAFSPTGWTSPDDNLRNAAVAAVNSAGGQAGAINANTSTSAGGHLYVGVGPVAAKTNSVGVKTGFNATRDTGLLALTDVDGDNLPDKVFTSGGGVVYRKNLAKPGGQARFADQVTPLHNLPGIMSQRSSSSTVGVEAYPGGVAAQLDHVDTFTTNERYLSDVNGDGITDLVDGGSVLFGRIGPDGAPVYGLSAQTPVPIGSAPVDTDGLLGDLSADRAREIESHPLIDTLRRWVAPYDGTVAVSGAVRLVADDSPDRAAYAKADGVRVAVQQEDAELWSELIGPADYADHTPTGVDAVTVHRGDRLYFRVQSRFDGAYDQVAWDPQVRYTGVPATTDVNGLDPYAYRASADFTLGGRTGTVTVPVTGTVHLSGDLTKKAATTDDVTAVITRDGTTVFTRTLAAADTGDLPVDLDLPVQQGQKLAWRIKVDSPIDLSQVDWTPQAAYADPAAVITAPYDVDMYPADDLTGPQQSYTAPADGDLTVAPSLDFDDSNPTARVVFTVKSRDRLLAKTAMPVDQPLTVPVTAGDELFFDFSTLDPGLAAHVTGHSVQVGFDPAELTPAPDALHSAAAEGAFPEPYRGWGAIGYNGNGDRAGQPVKQTDLVIDESYKDQLPDHVDPQAQKDDFAADPKVTPPNAVPYMPDPADDRWGSDNNTWVGRTTVSSSRLGTTAIVVPTASDFATVTAVPRMSRSTQISLTGGVSLPVGSLGGSIATGDSTADTDYLDLNGDGFPDVIGASGVQYTVPTGELGTDRAALPGRTVRRTGTVAGNANAGSAARTITTGHGDAAPPADITANTAVSGNDMPPLGVGGNLGSGTSDTAFDLLDINGDALPDRVYADGRAALNLGYRFAAPEPWPGGKLNDGQTTNAGANIGFNTDFYGFAGGASFSVGHSSTKASLVDVNGDGLADRVFEGNPVRVAINTGSGFAAPQPFLGGAAGVNDDANAELGGGAYVEFSACFLIFFGGCIITNPGANFSTGIGRTEQALRDINGDGFADQLRSTSDDHLSVAENQTGRTNLLKAVSRPLGARIDLDYTRDGNTYDQPQSRFVLSKAALSDGHSGDGVDAQVTTFRYGGGVYDRLEREFRGYHSVVSEQRDQAGQVYRSTTTEYDTTSHYTRGLVTRTRIADGDGKAFTESVNSYQLIDVNTSAVADPASTTAVIFPQLVRTDQRYFEGQDTPGKTTSVQMSYDDVGNLIRSYDSADTGTADDVETKIRYTAEDTACRTSGVVGKAKAMDVRGGGTLLRHSESTIDCATGDVKQQRESLANGTVATTDVTYFANGNVQSVTEPPNAGRQRYKVTYEYDPALATHVTAVTDSFGLRSTTSYNLKYGLPETITDTNGQQTRTLYDQQGRVDTVTGPYEMAANHPTVDIEYHPEAVVPYAITRNVDRNADGSFRTNSIDTITFTDGLGRVIQSKKDATLDGVEAMTVSGHVEYDFAGRVVASSYPVTEAKGPLSTRFTTKIDPVTPTRTSYDVLDRATRTVLPDGAATSAAYGFGLDRDGITQFTTAVTDANGATTRTYTDVDFRSTAVKQPNDAWTSYAYDPLGQITTVVDDHRNITRATYDNLGRRTSVATPDTGTTQSEYDLAGNLTKRVTANLAAKRKAIKYDYDFDRLTAVSYPTTPDANVTYTYGAPGAAGNAAGRITSVRDAAGTVTRAYGPLGETTAETRTVANGIAKATSFTTRYQYDTWNRMQTMTYPDGEVLTYHYDNGGQVDAASGVKGSTTYPYVTALNYDKFGQRIQLRTGNGVTTNYTYDATDRRLATLQAAQANGTTFQQMTYAYDDVGNVTGITEGAAAVGGQGGPSSQSFGYDTLNRLTSSAGEYHPASGLRDQYTLDLTYDSLGDVTAKNQTHDLVTADGTATPDRDTSYQYAYAYGGTQPHAPTSVGPFTFRYDADGNLVTRTGPDKEKLQLTYDDADQLVCSDSGSGHHVADTTELVSLDLTGGSSCDTSYVYGEDGQRVVKDGGSNDVTVYPSESYTLRNKTAYKHVFLGDTRLVSQLVQTNGSVENNQFYFSTDHLGSTAYGTDGAGKVVEHDKYLPSGEAWANEKTTAAPSPYGFNGKELDTETGLYYYGSRYYDPRTTLWQSADPSLPDYLDGEPAGGVGNPGNLSAYTYTADNPVRYTDPDGRWFNIAIGAAIGAAISAGVEGYSQYRAGEFSARRLIGAAAGGAVSGAVTGATLGTGLLAEAAVAAGGSAAEGVVTRAIDGDPQSIGAIASDAGKGLLGLGGAKVGAKIVKAARGALGKAESSAAAAAKAETTAAKAEASAAEDAAAKQPKDSLSPCNSFAGDTLVLRGDGSTVRISELQPGDTVVATDPITGKTSVREVTLRHVNRDIDLTDVTVADKDGHATVIHTTQHHPFWDASRRAWVDAYDLRAGERLRTTGVPAVTITTVRNFTAPRTMFNLTVDTVHTYYVLAGAVAVLVHNAGGAGPCKVGQQGEASAGIVKNNAKIKVNGRVRKPDELTSTTIGEVKNVKYQYLSRQLKDYLAYAQKNKLKMVLYVRKGDGTAFSPQLKALEDAGKIIVKRVL
ncbi:SpvB/TcaC N-terminal domain-containing protein [Mangrovihabitans endophyticus]|nr:SpvB/TcaC N-terminal domain-containing protein [Mangrovihabitans endophyticus]